MINKKYADMEYWKTSIYPPTDLDDLRRYVDTTEDNTNEIIRKLSIIKKETEFNITLCMNSQSEDANEIRELGAEIISFIDCEVYKLSTSKISLKYNSVRYKTTDLFNKDILNYLKSNSHTLLEDIREYLETHPLGKDIYTLITFLYNCDKIRYWDNTSHKHKYGCIISNKPQTSTKWRDAFCTAFQIDINLVKNYKPKSPAIVDNMENIKKHFHYL